jgi:perosamine synthetase
MENQDLLKSIKDISVFKTCTIREAMQAIDKSNFGLALIVNAQSYRFEGLVTDGDLRRALLKGHGLESPLSIVQRPETTTAHIGTSRSQITTLFSDKIRVIPILNDNDQVVDLMVYDKRIHFAVSQPLMGEKELVYVAECILTGWVSSVGKFVTRFEREFADYNQAKYAISTSNGTTALHLALLALGIGPGDEVIVPSLTFIATANAVAYTGATPIFADSTMETWNIDETAVENLLTPRTKAIIPVHLYGHPVNMDPILKIAQKFNLKVIEDAAEAHGATYKGSRVGGIGDIGIFSFYGNKIITTGEGGMVLTNDHVICEKIRLLRDHGMSQERRYWHPIIGYNYRMTNLQAALGVAQMEKIESILKRKKDIADEYSLGLKNIPGITLPPCQSWAENVYWLYSIIIDKHKFGLNRDELLDYLKKEGVETRPFFIPCHKQPCYDLNLNLPVANFLSENGLSLPSSPQLTRDDIFKIVKLIQNSSQRREGTP